MSTATGNLVSLWQSRQRQKLVADLLTYIIVLTALFIVALPFVWMTLTAFKSSEELFLLPPRWLPERLNWANFTAAWRALPMARFYLNTLVVATSVALLQVLNAALVAYVFVRIEFPGREIVFLLILGVMMIPAQVIIIPAFVTLSRLKWIDTYWALIVPHMSSAFAIFLFRQAFFGVPDEMVDAAKVDGAGHLRVLFQIMLPLVRPVVITVALLSFTWTWNDYFWPLIMTNTMEMRTLPVGLVFLRAQENLFQYWNILMAGTLLVLLPILALFFLAQRWFVLSVTRSGLHGSA